MKVFIQGATGVLGRRLVRDFALRGHEVVGLARSQEGARAVRAAGGVPVTADIFDAEALARVAQDCEVLIRAATAIPKKPKLKPADFAVNNRLRTEGTRAMIGAARKVGAKTFLQESIVWVARPQDGSPFDEDTPPQGGPFMDPMIAAEKMAKKAAAEGGMEVVTLRLGNFYAPEAYHTRYMGERLAKHRLPVIGRGEAALSLIHADDASAAFLTAAESPHSGIFHVLDNEPVAVRDLLSTFASKLDARPPGRVPPWLARLAGGRYVAEFFTVSMRTSNARFRQAFGWKPRYASYREGLDQIVVAWRKEGYLVREGSQVP